MHFLKPKYWHYIPHHRRDVAKEEEEGWHFGVAPIDIGVMGLVCALSL